MGFDPRHGVETNDQGRLIRAPEPDGVGEPG